MTTLPRTSASQTTSDRADFCSRVLVWWGDRQHADISDEMLAAFVDAVKPMFPDCVEIQRSGKSIIFDFNRQVEPAEIEKLLAVLGDTLQVLLNADATLREAMAKVLHEGSPVPERSHVLVDRNVGPIAAPPPPRPRPHPSLPRLARQLKAARRPAQCRHLMYPDRRI